MLERDRHLARLASLYAKTESESMFEPHGRSELATHFQKLNLYQCLSRWTVGPPRKTLLTDLTETQLEQLNPCVLRSVSMSDQKPSDQKPDDNGLLTFIATTVETMRDQMATKDDLAQLATKDELRQVEFRLGARLEAETKAIRGDIEQVQLRLNTIERALTTRLNQIETELSRLRSVVYLLAKDKPELLRLLGQETPPS
jgi:hypothetical protein